MKVGLEDRDAVSRALQAVLVGAVVVGALITVGSLVNHFLLDDAITDLDAGQEQTLNNWLTVVGSFGAAVGALLMVPLSPRRTRMLLAIAAIFTLISIDDLIALHERVGSNIGIDHIETLIFAPLYAFGLLLTWRLARELEPGFARLLRVALVLLGTSIVIDLGSSFTVDLQKEGTEWPQPTRIALEEGFEVAGWLLMAGTLLTLSAATSQAGPRGSIRS